VSSSSIEMEYVYLEYVRLTEAAERQPASVGNSRPDHIECRRLAFVRWLDATGRQTEALQRRSAQRLVS